MILTKGQVAITSFYTFRRRLQFFDSLDLYITGLPEFELQRLYCREMVHLDYVCIKQWPVSNAQINVIPIYIVDE